MFIRIIAVHLYQQKQIIMNREIKFIKVPVSERRAEKSDVFFTLEDDGKKSTRLFDGKRRFFGTDQPEYYLIEVPDREAEIIDMLEACRKELDYLNTFQPRPSTKEFISKLETLLNELK